MKAACLPTRVALPRLPDGPLGPRRDAHLASCLACQAEAAKYRALHRSLQSMRRIEFRAPPGLLSAVLTATRQAVVPVRRHRAAIAALVTGAAAVAAGAIALLVHRQRRAVA